MESADLWLCFVLPLGNRACLIFSGEKQRQSSLGANRKEEHMTTSSQPFSRRRRTQPDLMVYIRRAAEKKGNEVKSTALVSIHTIRYKFSFGSFLCAVFSSHSAYAYTFSGKRKKISRSRRKKESRTTGAVDIKGALRLVCSRCSIPGRLPIFIYIFSLFGSHKHIEFACCKKRKKHHYAPFFLMRPHTAHKTGSFG